MKPASVAGLCWLAIMACAGFAQAASAPLETLDGRPVDYAQLPAVSVLLFWDTDCSYCVEELHDIRAAGDAAFAARLATIALVPRQAAADWRERLPAAALTLATRIAPQDLLAHFGNADGGMPYAVVLDAHRKVCRRLVGRTSLAELQAGLAACDAGGDHSRDYNR